MEIGVRRFHNNFSATIIFISGKDLQKIKFSANLTHHIFSFFSQVQKRIMIRNGFFVRDLLLLWENTNSVTSDVAVIETATVANPINLKFLY